MKVKSCCLGLFVLVFGLGVVGCVSRPGLRYQKGKLYYGPKLPDHKVAYLQRFYGPLTIIVDGQGWKFSSHYHVRATIPAGVHEIEWYHKPSGANFTYHGKGTLDAKPGKYYLIYCRYLSGEIESYDHRFEFYGSNITEHEYYTITVVSFKRLSPLLYHLINSLPGQGLVIPIPTLKKVILVPGTLLI